MTGRSTLFKITFAYVCMVMAIALAILLNTDWRGFLTSLLVGAAAYAFVCCVAISEGDL